MIICKVFRPYRKTFLDNFGVWNWIDTVWIESVGSGELLFGAKWDRVSNKVVLITTNKLKIRGSAYGGIFYVEILLFEGIHVLFVAIFDLPFANNVNSFFV